MSDFLSYSANCTPALPAPKTPNFACWSLIACLLASACSSKEASVASLTAA